MRRASCGRAVMLIPHRTPDVARRPLHHPPVTRTPSPGIARHRGNHGASGGRWNCVTKPMNVSRTPARLSISAVCRCAPPSSAPSRTLGFRGLDNDLRDPVVVTGFHAHKLTPGQKEANRVLAVGRAPVERGFAYLKNWRVLAKLRTDHARAPQLLCALLVLTNPEVDADRRPTPQTAPTISVSIPEDRHLSPLC
ncbi:transposase family protein [Streptomyces sp. NPDC001135]